MLRVLSLCSLLAPLGAWAQTVPAGTNEQPFQLGIVGSFAFGGSSANDAALAGLQAGGHDPNRNGFTVQNVEVVAQGAVDPYFDARTNLAFLIDAAGETVVELEEAFLRTRALPFGLQVKAGQYYTEFGRHNEQHPHQWAFVDQPVVLSRFFGPDGLRSAGARVAWLAPVPWFSEFTVGAQNAAGETLASFLYAPGESVGGYTLIDRGGARSFGDLLFSARWLNGVDVSDSLSANLGVSALRGPNATGMHTNTDIVGVDLYMKWRPDATQRGFPFVAWQTEWLARDYATPGDPLKDSGGYTQVLWGYKPGWVLGLRGEYVDGDPSDNSDPLRDRRQRISPNLTWYPTEYSKIRLQYNRDEARHLAAGHADSVWLQYEFAMGAHVAHQY